MVDNSNHIMDCCCLLIPHSTGAVTSLDRFMRDNRDVVKFQQVGAAQGTGHMKFYDKNDQETHAVTMEERNGLWHASNSILMPPTAEGPTKRTDSLSPSLQIHKLDMKQEVSTDVPLEEQKPSHNPDRCFSQEKRNRPQESQNHHEP
jgi:hypothetical protein